MKKIFILSVIVVSFLSMFATDTFVTVKADGTGDFQTIHNAFYSQIIQSNGGIIWVYPGTYGGDELVLTSNQNLSIQIIGINRNSCIIDGCDSQQNVFGIFNAHSNLVLKNLTIKRGLSSGVKIHPSSYGTSTIQECLITGCGNENPAASANKSGVLCYGNVILKDNIFENNHNSWYDAFFFDYSKGGALYVHYVDSSIIDGYVKVTGNSFIGNFAADCGAMYIESNQNIMVNDNYFHGNGMLASTNNPLGNYPGYCPIATFESCDNVCFSNNIVWENLSYVYPSFPPQDMNGIVFKDCLQAEIHNNTVSQNLSVSSDGGIIGFVLDGCTGCTYSLSNNLIFNNRKGIDCYSNGGVVNIDYNDVYNNPPIYNGAYNYVDITAGIHDISVEPHLDLTTFVPKWISYQKSPCIDAGDPSILDADGTPSDIGAVCAVDHRFDEVDLPSPFVDNGWKWLSFPSLDVILNDADLAGNVLDDILDPTILDVVLGSNLYIHFENNQWQDVNEQFLRTEGYKLHMNAAATLDVPGFKVPDNTIVPLTGGGNATWVGYWLDDTQSVEDAFGSYWDGGNIYSVKHQKWSAYRSNGEWSYKVSAGYENPTLSYGEMVEIKCTTGISNFCWDNSTPADQAVTFAEPAVYSYEEQADYLPLFIQLDGDDMPQEIGAFVGDTCIGASVVEADQVQINAYVSSAPAGTIELQFSYGGRAADRRISQFNCVELSDPHHVLTELPSRSGGDAYFINLRDGEAPTPGITTLAARNYPNPFNPETTISYSLPQDGPVCVKVFNSRGQLVTTLVDGEQPSGVYTVTWKGTDAAGNHVSSGIYFYRVTSGNTSINRKMVLLK